MTARLSRGAIAALFVLLATANSGGYRYAASDQAFYLPAIAAAVDPSLFPHDRPLLAPQARVWFGDNALAPLIRLTRLDLPAVAGVLYVTGLLLLIGSAVYFSRGLGASTAAVAAGLALFTLRHRITKTGANSLEGYFHPRMISFALGLWALGFVLKRRFGAAFLLIGLAVIVHTTTALWFGLAVLMAAAWDRDRRSIAVAFATIALAAVALLAFAPRMDDAWLAPLAGKDYLFPAEWPWYAWAINLGYSPVLWLLHRRRRRLGVSAAGEPALVVGLLMLALGFLVSVILTMAGVAIAVQLQITRVFWIIDGVVVLMLAWWLADDLAARRGVAWSRGLVAVLLLLSAARGVYVLAIEVRRPLAQWTLPPDDWSRTMSWLQSQPAGTNVLASPDHALRQGSSIRVAALRDTVLEEVKDTALAMYDRDVALRVGERMRALAGFAEFTEADLRSAGARYAATLLLVGRSRVLSLPVMYENATFVVYDLR